MSSPEWKFPLLQSKFIDLIMLGDQIQDPETTRRVKDTCTRKVAYRSAVTAKLAASECLRKSGSFGLEAYECPFCLKYHVGHPNTVQAVRSFIQDCIIAVWVLAPESLGAARRMVVYSYLFNQRKLDMMPGSQRVLRSRKAIEVVKVQAMVVLSLREKEFGDVETG